MSCEDYVAVAAIFLLFGLVTIIFGVPYVATINAPETWSLIETPTVSKAYRLFAGPVGAALIFWFMGIIHLIIGALANQNHNGNSPANAG
jgi:hypothetical protein